MKTKIFFSRVFLALLLSLTSLFNTADSQVLKTPLSQEILTMLTNEISGQVVFNNEVLLCGAPWIRDKKEFSGTFYESEKIYELVKNYGIKTTKLIKYPSDRGFDYPFEAEFWITEPQRRLVAKLEADPALVAGGSESADISGELIYIPPVANNDLSMFKTPEAREKYSGKIAVMWSHARGNTARALDEAGIKGVISFRSQEQYIDPDQVIYSRGSYKGMENLKLGFTVSWRQWSELLEDLQKGRKYTVNCKTRIEEFPGRFEMVYSWIPGTEPDKKGIIFTAHLFEGYTKRGANDNMSGCVAQLEILRALTKLIKNGDLPQPRRNIYFLWPNEISGTYEFIKQNPGIADTWSININMDMVGEALRANNAKFTMTECPNHLPSYIDGLGRSILNYVWRTNDIVYLPDSPRGRSGSQFPVPMLEKNGTRDAFRFFMHRATGGSDHICFVNPMVGVPGIELNIWPDLWYHSDKDLPDKSDPTQLKRTAFIGAAMAYTAANCTDEILGDLLDEVADFGYGRIGERELPTALKLVDKAAPDKLNDAVKLALNMVDFAVEREAGAVESVREIYSGSQNAKILVNNREKQFELYGKALNEQILEYAKLKAGEFKVDPPTEMKMTADEKKYSKIIPKINEKFKGKEFSFQRSDAYREYLRNNPDFLRKTGLNRYQTRYVLNYVNGKRSIAKIKDCIVAETGSDVSLESVLNYMNMLKEIEWIRF
ncbi:M28 family peptidase [candidate division KSB1 bacterium]